MQRRHLLKLGLASAAALAVIGGGVALLHEPGWHGDRLTGSGRKVLGAVARAVLEGSLPTELDAGADALNAHLARVEAAIRSMSPATQRELGDLLSLLAVAPGRIAIAGLSTDWPHANVAQVQSALQSMRLSRLPLRQQAYHALRDLTHAAYFADRGTWPRLGYPGPIAIE